MLELNSKSVQIYLTHSAMKNLLFAGIDVSKDSFDITIINQNTLCYVKEQNLFQVENEDKLINVIYS